MSILGIILVAFGLSMDAFAVSITQGISLEETRVKSALKIGAFFSVFQALMPMIGWLLGSKLSNYITKIDHWIAFLLLSIIGGKMIYETIKTQVIEDGSEENGSEEKKPINNKTLCLLGIATSIDALAVGVSFAFLNVSILRTTFIIGIITFGLCFSGVLIGKKCGEILRSHAGLFGGIILIAIGAKIFIEHLKIISIFKSFL